MLWISKALRCVLDFLFKHGVSDMNRLDKNASCLTPSKTVRMFRLNGYLQKTSKKRMNREGSYHCSLINHCSMTIFRLWRELTLAIQSKDMEQATVSKTLVEDAQREQRKYMEERGKKHEARFFEQRNGRWAPKLQYVFPSFQTKKNDIFDQKKYLECPKTLKKPQRPSRTGYSLQRRNTVQLIPQCHPNPNKTNWPYTIIQHNCTFFFQNSQLTCSFACLISSI